MIAFRPEPQTRLIVVAEVVVGEPGLAARPGAPAPARRRPAGPGPSGPRRSVASAGSSPARSTAARIATPPSSIAGTVLSAPPNLPIGVRAALTMIDVPVRAGAILGHAPMLHRHGPARLPASAHRSGGRLRSDRRRWRTGTAGSSRGGPAAREMPISLERRGRAAGDNFVGGVHGGVAGPSSLRHSSIDRLSVLGRHVGVADDDRRRRWASTGLRQRQGVATWTDDEARASRSVRASRASAGSRGR